MSPWTIMMGLVLLLTPIICWAFTLHAPETRTKLNKIGQLIHCLLYTSPSPRDVSRSRMPSSA